MNTNDMTLKEKSYFYQHKRDYTIDIDNFIVVHIDGRSFSKMVKNKFEKPFSNDFINMMNKTAIYLCEQIQGAQMAYVQSDEITLILKKKNPESDVFFSGRLCKMHSIIASLASTNFNKMMLQYNITKNSYSNTLEDCEGTLYTIKDVIEFIGEQPNYQFDCKVWDVPNANEAMSWLLFRNIDCVRNSKQQTAQSYLPHKILVGKSTDEQIQLLYEKEGIEWSKFEEGKKYGRFIVKEYVECTREEKGQEITFTRSKWTIKNGMDLTNQNNREILKEMCSILKE